LIPKLFHQQQLFGRGESLDFGSEGGVHAAHNADEGSGGKCVDGQPRVASLPSLNTANSR
jgi:hypothetical protein